MKPKIKPYLLFLFVLFPQIILAQIQDFKYLRSLNEVKSGYHQITIPDEMYAHTKADLSDVRIYRVDEKNDTLEVPYIINSSTPKTFHTTSSFNILNRSRSSDGYVFIFELKDFITINKINLNFSQSNFDWNINLEGSQDMKEWLSVLTNYRILSVKNENTDYRFCNIIFPDSKFHYYKITIHTDQKPDLIDAGLGKDSTSSGSYHRYTNSSVKQENNKLNHQTEITTTLPGTFLVTLIEVKIRNTFDYYRPVQILCMTDSFKTETGWKYNFETIYSGTLSSLEKNVFTSNRIVSSSLIRIIIDNGNNEPLLADSVIVSGVTNELSARFTGNGNSFMVYGNTNCSSPVYDLNIFSEKIPDQATVITAGEEIRIPKTAVAAASPLFKNKMWLWIVMTFVILLLGWFSFKMMRS